ncbi:MAG: FdhF/YdeP family oxidoreductase [Fuerstiella sp.]|nr:FdhF/YdeP family oxidoreductase [Fuerstiella sp.]MCP4512672.1 FdhF/YdeP family oxidoreductase [Fuerstiella sp.]
MATDMKRPRSGGGWKAIRYSMRLASRVGWWKTWKAMRSKNACRTCAVGMGGQRGGMVNEGGHFPEVCKKSFQAMASDLQGAIPSSFWQRYDIHKLRSMTSRQLEHCGRIAEPVVLEKGASSYRPIGWDEALQRVADGMTSAGPDRSFFYASGRSSNEAGFLLQLISRLFGTNYVNNCSYYCHQASGVGLGSSIGTGAGTVRLDDLNHTDLYILIGANPASNHPRLMKALMEIRRRGGKVIVVNPVKEIGLMNFRIPSDARSLLFGSEIASSYVQPHVGGDIAWLLGVAKEVLDRGQQDQVFLDRHTEGFEEFRRLTQATSWDEIVSCSGVSREQIQLIAEQYISAKNVVIGWCMGITHHLHGTNSVQMIANVALLRGMVGRRRAGVMPIRGHSNVQGLGSVGVTPALKAAALQKMEERLKIKAPTSPGYDTMACMNAAHRGEMGFSLCLGGNLYGSNPDLQYAEESMSRLRTLVYMSTTLNTGHAWGRAQDTLILPVLPRDEEPQSTTQESMFSYVRLSDGGAARFAGPRSEVSVLADVGRRVFGMDSRVDFEHLRSHAALQTLIGELVPGYEGMSGIRDHQQEFYVSGRAIEDYRFPTENGRARFHSPPLPQREFAQDEFRLMTVRSEGQFNSVVFEEEDLYRGQERRDIVLMNADDIRQLGLKENQRIRVKSEVGELRMLLVREYEVRAGSVLMYYPEANMLVPNTVDPLSRTPGFKSTKVTIRAEQAGVS